MSESGSKRTSWISVGEAIALAALIISGLGLWIAWQDSNKDGPTRIVEQRQAVPLTLRGVPDDSGRVLEILPVEQGHGLQSLAVSVKGQPPIEVGSDGRLAAADLERALGKAARKDGAVTARIDARYVEAGTDRRASRAYRIRYRWEGGGLFGGRSLRITGLSR
jgi:hypothetical protein